MGPVWRWACKGGMTNPVCQWDKLLILDATEGIDGVALFIFSF